MNSIATITPVLLVGERSASDHSLKMALRRKFCVPAEAPDVSSAVEILSSGHCSAVIMDFAAVDRDDMSCLRRVYGGPLVALCTDANEETFVRAMEWGADDVLTAPIRVVELYGRIGALLHRARRQSEKALDAGDIIVDFAARRVTVSGETVRLTRTEFDILAFLIRNQGRVVHQQEILKHVWGPHHGEYSQTLRIHVGHIRKKIERNFGGFRYILTEPGVGYIFRSRGQTARNAEAHSAAAE